MTTSMHLQKVKQSWDMKKTQEAAAKHAAHRIVSRLQYIEKNSGKEIDELERDSALLKADMMKKCGVKTPMDLVKHIAEFEVNLYGAEASIQGDENNAILVTEKSTVWEEARKLSKMSKDQEVRMQTHYRHWIDSLAQGLGFKSHLEIANDGVSSKLTFTTK